MAPRRQMLTALDRSIVSPVKVKFNRSQRTGLTFIVLGVGDNQVEVGTASQLFLLHNGALEVADRDVHAVEHYRANVGGRGELVEYRHDGGLHGLACAKTRWRNRSATLQTADDILS